VKYPSILLSGIPFTFTADLPPFLDDNATIPYNVEVALYINDTILYTKNDIITRSINGTSKLSLSLGRVPDNASGYSIGLGYHEFTFKVFNDNGGLLCQDDQVKLAIPAWLTLFPPILTALIAIFLRQILLALLVGIWLGVCLVQEYNVFTAMLRTLDTYIVSAMADFDHSEIIIGTFFLGGLIGLIQKSGGGLGLANLFSRFAKTSRRGCLICFGVALLIFFDDYTSVLITGTSLRTIMYSSGVSKDKFAFIVQSMAPTMASFIPVSSWIGAQIGYASSGFQYCDSNNDSEFTIIIKTLPYRFLPFLTFYCVILVCVLNRDFACMLVSEKKNYVEHRALSSQGERTPPPGEMKGTSDTSQSDIEDLFEGPLAPKKGTPFRWFNAVIPFLIVIVFTFVGMILDGWSTINSNNDDLRNDHINMTVMNIFGNADAIAAVIWSTCLATFVIILLVLIQRILKFTECMNAWIEGVKDVIEPLFILILAWGLGNVIAEIQTSSFIAEILRSGNISYHYIPVITTIIGYFMAYCTGSAFGTMGILFPLVIPTTCQLTDDEDIQVQAAAAILSSCIFGNLMSPIADLTVLTRVSTQCDLNSHIKTCSVSCHQ
jgi:Na+/H+ antiporter NhaC